MSMSFFQDLLGSIADRGRTLLDRSTPWSGAEGPARIGRDGRPAAFARMCRALLSGEGEASSLALARQLHDLYARLDAAERLEAFRFMARDLDPDPERLRSAWAAHEAAASPATLRALLRAVEPPRQELIRRLNLAPGGTAALVRMREDLLPRIPEAAELASVDDDLAHLLGSWFNRGFLVLRRIDWSSPADILERIIRYEAVHTIRGWDDLRRRVQPPDRRCFGFFHPSLVDEPLIFVEVALTADVPGSIQSLLTEERQVLEGAQATTAVFYSISNCQPGLRGISLGNFLIKQVVAELSRDLPNLKTFVTLSPVPGFGPWLRRIAEAPPPEVEGIDLRRLGRLRRPDWHTDAAAMEALRPLLLRLAATYLLQVKGGGGRPQDPVARFHLGNGARLERLNWLGDTSEKGLGEAAGLMVNYLYDPRYIEANHEAFFNQGTVATSSAVRRHLREAVPPPSGSESDVG